MNKTTIRRSPSGRCARRTDNAATRSQDDRDAIALQVDRLRRRFSISDTLAKALAPIVFGEASR